MDPKADVLKSDIEDLLQSGAEIPEPQMVFLQEMDKQIVSITQV